MTTLRMLILAVARGRTAFIGEQILVAWSGQPPDASGRIGADLANGDADLGDYAMAAFPAPVESPGLWLLEWDYEMVPHPEVLVGDDEADDDEDGLLNPELTAVYADTCRA